MTTQEQQELVCIFENIGLKEHQINYLLDMIKEAQLYNEQKQGYKISDIIHNE